MLALTPSMTSFMKTMARLVGDAAALSPMIVAPYGVEVTSRNDGDTIYYFLLNLTETAHEGIELPGPMTDLIRDQQGVTRVSLGPLDVAVLASAKKA